MAELMKQGAALAAPLSGEMKSIQDKSAMLDDYKHATAPATPAAPAKTPTANVDKIKPTAKYGDRPSEQRIDTSSMTKPLGSFAKGTDYVPKTGQYKLHEGEAVIPKEKNMKTHTDKMKASLSGDDKPKKEIKEIRTRKTHDGHLVHTHIHHSPAHHPDEEHISADSAQLHQHMDDHSGMAPNDGEQPAAPAAGQDAPAQLTAAPSQPMAPAAQPGA